MNELNNFLLAIDNHIGGSQWFVFSFLARRLFTIYLKFPQFRYLKHSIRIVRGKFDREGDEGDTTHFQALATALSGTVGTGTLPVWRSPSTLAPCCTFLDAGYCRRRNDHKICGSYTLP